MTQPTIDFAVLDLDTSPLSVLNRRAMAWLVGMLLLAGVSIVLLGLFLRTVEAQEEDRRRTADAQWLDQTLRFHFRRLESDLGMLALQVQRNGEPAPPALPAGQLWRSPGVIAWHGWLAAQTQSRSLAAWPLFMQSAAPSPEAAEALAAMLKTTQGLQRAAYAGPLAGAGASPAPLLWLAVPVFERDRFLGDYLAAIDLDRLLASAIPAWFFQDHAVALDADNLPAAPAGAEALPRYIAPINLPGVPLRLRVNALRSTPALAPRVFFGIALLCLAAMVVALYFLRRDTARRQRAESQLQTQMALRRAMERSVTLGLRAWTTDGRLLYANQTFCQMVGLPLHTILNPGGAAPPYWPDGQGDEFERLVHSVRLPRERQAGVEIQLRHSQGALLDVLAHGAPLTLGDGRVIGWMGSVLDITERKRIERLAARRQELLEASGRLVAVGEVASTLAHELNQPLGALSSFANGLLNRLRAGRITLDEVAPVVERMERLAEKAGRVIQRVNAFARRQDMRSQPLALNAFVSRVTGQVPLPDDLALEVSLPDATVTVPADALLLEHALHNLVLNATEWAAQGGPRPARVRISLAPDGDLARIRVEDSGPGVPDDQRDRIFDAFASQKAGGMGMGLSICRSIVEAHHGRIDVSRSMALKGAQFTVWLPLTLQSP